MMKLAMKQIVIVGLLLVVGMVGVSGSAHAAANPATPAAGTSFEKRLAQRKAEQKITLEDKDKSRIEQRCESAQSKVRSLYQTTSTALNSRNEAYYRADAKLWVVIGRLKLANRDTFQLEKQRASFAKQIADFQVTTNNFTQVLDDIQVVNCKADPVGFKALVETARIYRKQIVDKSNAIRDFAVNDIKQTLSTHATELQPKTEGTE
jgi:hypothetical protein